MERLSRYGSKGLLLAASLFYFLPLGRRALWDPLEGQCAEITREMLSSGFPYLRSALYFEKPPLFYWLSTLAMSVFGQHEFAARFWCASFAVLTVSLAYLIGKHWQGKRAGLLSGGVLATSFGFFGFSQYLTLDMAFTFWAALALYGGSRLVHERQPARIRRFAFVFAIGVAGGILTQGLSALLLPLAGMGLAIRYSRQETLLQKIPWAEMFFLILLIVTPWLILGGWRYAFSSQALFRSPISRPFWFYLPVGVAAFLPWTFFLPAVFHSWLHRQGTALKRDAVAALLVFWTFFGFLLFSFWPVKSAGGILPLFPALAVLVGEAFDRVADEPVAAQWVRRGIVAMMGAWTLVLVIGKWPGAIAFTQDSPGWLLHVQGDALAFVLAIVIFILAGVWGMRRNSVCFGGIVLCQILVLSTVVLIAPEADSQLSSRGIAEVLAKRRRPENPVVGCGSYEGLGTLSFYLKERVTVFEKWDQAVQESLLRMPAGTWVVADAEHHKALLALPHTPFQSTSHVGRDWLMQKVQ